jgi:GH25 family lysozyme M1 (1,4-beta-N-acetylmuramidase)
MPTMHGFDVSHWNTVTAESAIPRYPLMSAKATEGKGGRDPRFGAYWAMFKRLKVKYRGAYHWLRSDSTAREQVDNFLTALRSVGAYSPSSGLEPGALLQLDWERTPNIPDPPLAVVEEWCQRITDAVGDRLIVYSADWVGNFKTWRARHPDTPLWYSSFNMVDGPLKCARYGADVWQFSDKFPVPGFAAGIDGNQIIKASVLDRVCGVRHEADVPPPKPTPDEDDMHGISSVTWQGRQHLFMRAEDGSLCHEFWDGADWQCENHGGILTGSPSAVVSPDGNRLDVFGRGGDGAIWQNTYTAGADDWEGWHKISDWP